MDLLEFQFVHHDSFKGRVMDEVWVCWRLHGEWDMILWMLVNQFCSPDVIYWLSSNQQLLNLAMFKVWLLKTHFVTGFGLQEGVAHPSLVINDFIGSFNLAPNIVMFGCLNTNDPFWGWGHDWGGIRDACGVRASCKRPFMSVQVIYC